MSQRLEDVFDQVPVNALLGIVLIERNAESSLVALDPDARHTQGYGAVQGGLLAALADAAGACCFLPERIDRPSITSIEFKINFLRPALPDRGRIVARARVLRRGQRIGVADVDVVQDGDVVAKGLFTYLLFQEA